jgi:hypothetical protein
MNPLDIYKSYTYHFELHVATSIDKLQAEFTTVRNDSTLPDKSNGTLLINTRKDAHQVIDNVKFTYASPQLDSTGTHVGIVKFDMMIIEPNGSSFIEKIQNFMFENNISDIIANAVFLLKIIFVGRHEDNSVNVSDIEPVPIVLNLHKITLDFDHKGGVYHLDFVGSAAGIIQSTNNFGYSHKNIAVKSITLREALSNLETSINDAYKDQYRQIEIQGKPVRYQIILDPNINGTLNLSSKESFVDGDPTHAVFQPETPIIEMIKRLVQSCKEVNMMIAESSAGLSKEGFPNVRYPTYSVRYLLTDSEALITYEVILFEGKGVRDDNAFIFDFLFAEPSGKNVDVIKFNIHYDKIQAWLTTTFDNSVDWHTNQSGGNEIPKNNGTQWSQQILTSHKKTENIPNQDAENVALQKLSLILKDNDVQIPAGTNVRQNSGHPQLTHKGAQAARLAFNTISEISGATNINASFLIRGHYGLLKPCIPTPYAAEIPGVGDKYGFGQTDGLWVKVNIKRQDPSTGGKPYQEFFYTGYYQILKVTHIFENGQFTQQLDVIMKDRVDTTGSSGSSSIAGRISSSTGNSGSITGESRISAPITDAFGNIQLGNN